MKIERIEVIPYALPFQRPYVTATGRLDRRELVLFRVWTTDGLCGLGEAVPLSLRGGASLAQVVSDLEGSRPQLEGNAASSATSAPARAAIDCALLDLAAKSAEEPAWRTLGADQVAAVRCNATLTAGTPEAVVADALDWARSGFTTFKLKAGGEDDVATVLAVRRALGAAAKIRIDANGSWSVAEATAALRAMEAFDLELVEQPVATLDQLAEVRMQTSIPVVADESIATVDEAQTAVRVAACDATTIKLSKVGSAQAARAIATTLPSYMSSALDGPVGIAAAAHLEQVLPDAGHAHGLATQRLFAEWPATSCARLDGDRLSPSDDPGLGVEIDEAALQKLRIDL